VYIYLRVLFWQIILLYVHVYGPCNTVVALFAAR
jgi:hypothetical protein